jgi:hypothetical protein
VLTELGISTRLIKRLVCISGGEDVGKQRRNPRRASGVVYSNGKDKSKWREWSMKTQAVGTVEKMGKDALFLNDFKLAELTGAAEQYTLSKEEQVKFDTNASAWTYLTSACKGKAFNIVGTCIQDVKTQQEAFNIYHRPCGDSSSTAFLNFLVTVKVYRCCFPDFL